MEIFFKLCGKCKQELPLTLFYKDKRQKDGATRQCKSCHTETNKPAIKKWAQKNKKERRAYQNQYVKQRKQTDDVFAMLCKLRGRQRYALNGGQKHAPTLELLGADPKDVWKSLRFEFFKKYNRMYSDKENIHIDHIRPCASFDLSKLEEQKKCFHWSNLQLLTAKDNLKKGSKWYNCQDYVKEMDNLGKSLYYRNEKEENKVGRSLKKYIKQLSDYPEISIEEEKVLAIKAMDGDVDSRNKLIEANLKLVVYIARKYFWFGDKYGEQHNDDIVGEGNLALTKAATLYDPSRTDHFSLFASFIIEGQIKQYISKEMKHGTTSREYNESDFYAIDDSDGATTEYINKEQLYLIGNTLKSVDRGLSHDEKYVLNYRIMSEWPKTFQEIADILKLSLHTVMNIEMRIKIKIKHIMKTMPEFINEFNK